MIIIVIVIVIILLSLQRHPHTRRASTSPPKDDGPKAAEGKASEGSDAAASEAGGPEEGVYAVEKVLDSRDVGEEKQYLVRWKGYADSENTWEPAANILDSDLIKDFEEGASATDAADGPEVAADSGSADAGSTTANAITAVAAAAASAAAAAAVASAAAMAAASLQELPEVSIRGLTLEQASFEVRRKWGGSRKRAGGNRHYVRRGRLNPRMRLRLASDHPRLRARRSCVERAGFSLHGLPASSARLDNLKQSFH